MKKISSLTGPSRCLAVLSCCMLTTIASAQQLELAGGQPSLAGSAAGTSEQQRKPAPSVNAATDTYIVRLEASPVATYRGGIDGLAATANAVTGASRLDVNSPDSRSYTAFLDRAQTEFIEDCEAAFGHPIEIKHRYQHVVNGVAMVLTADEAAMVASADGVVAIEKERHEVLNTDVGPGWINAPSIWYGDGDGGATSKGEGTVIAILDSGINSNHPSFADIGGDGYDHTNPLGSGNFVPGSYCDTTDPSFCNDKLIGAWAFVRGPADPSSPEDDDGHGSHTASTAAGNVVQSASLIAPTTSFTRDISGVAPHAAARQRPTSKPSTRTVGDP